MKYKVKDNRTGKEYYLEGDHEPSEEEIQSHIDQYESSNIDVKDENSLGQDILEGAGLDPLAHPETIPNALMGMGMAAINPIGSSINMVKGLYDEGAARTGKYWDKMADDPNIGTAAQTMMAPIPYWGNVMENADLAIPRERDLETGNWKTDVHAGGRLGGNVLAAVIPKGGEIKSEVMAAKPAQYMMAGIDRFSPMMSAAFRSPLGTGLATGVGSYMFGSNPSTALYHGTMAALGKEGVGRLGMIMGGYKGMKAAAREAKASKLATSSQLENMAVERANVPVPKTELPPIEEDLLDRALNRSRAAKQGVKTPESKTPSKLDSLEEFPTRYKNVKIKGQTPPNPESSLTPLDPIPEKAPPTPDIPASIDKNILRKYVSEGEADQMLASIEEHKWLPETHEEWKTVNQLEEAGLDRMEAMKIVRAKKLEAAKAAGTPLNSREGGTNPRALGTSNRDRNVNPRALKNRRKEL